MENASNHGDQNQPSWLENDGKRRPYKFRRHWSRFELQTVLALLCKGVHEPQGGGVWAFVTQLNYALNGAHNFEDDISREDVQELLDWVKREKQPVLKAITRARTNKLTRAITYLFARHIKPAPVVPPSASGNPAAETVMAHVQEASDRADAGDGPVVVEDAVGMMASGKGYEWGGRILGGWDVLRE
ncbi:hypothetical protein QBC47DRAFT_412808 [Echria macrotheca]|uniref:Uncharacterized protein n=1 Tax=Echria macrotheca TaxID=438768 RepID=A0AAJ0BE77_9PEZI|nr:hypothetical protein QBC47DRAFT_412808 [Echria macrotheca]